MDEEAEPCPQSRQASIPLYPGNGDNEPIPSDGAASD